MRGEPGRLLQRARPALSERSQLDCCGADRGGGGRRGGERAVRGRKDNDDRDDLSVLHGLLQGRARQAE